MRTVQKPGLAIVDTEGVEISGLEVRNFCIGILVWRSKNNFIHHNRLFNNIGGAGVMFTGDNGAGGATSGLTVNNIAAHNEFVDNGDGLELTRGSDQNLVADNTFTMTASGLTPSQGIETINSSENRIVRNKFSNFSDGIQMNGGNRNYIAHNEFTGSSNGITLSGDGHVVERNVIHGNRLGIGPSAGNHTLTENSIFGNGQDIFLCNAGGTGGTPPACNPAYPQLGIDLGRDGVTPNDLAVSCADGFPDCDTGPNGRQNFPVLAPPPAVGSGLLILKGSLASRPNQAYLIELFANRNPGVVDGYGEGELFVGAARVVTDAAGNRDLQPAPGSGGCPRSARAKIAGQGPRSRRQCSSLFHRHRNRPRHGRYVRVQSGAAGVVACRKGEIAPRRPAWALPGSSSRARYASGRVRSRHVAREVGRRATSRRATTAVRYESGGAPTRTLTPRMLQRSPYESLTAAQSAMPADSGRPAAFGWTRPCAHRSEQRHDAP